MTDLRIVIFLSPVENLSGPYREVSRNQTQK
nr:MAG TPA: hypothetical protein [Caudoviricetes sp.]